MNVTIKPKRGNRPAGEGRRKPSEPEATSGMAVLGNRPFLLLWLAQLSTQVGGNMVIYGLTLIITAAYHSSSAVGALLLSFLIPAIVFSAMAGVFVDRVDKRHMLVVTAGRSISVSPRSAGASRRQRRATPTYRPCPRRGCRRRNY